MKSYLLLILYAITLCSCAQRRNLVYFSDLTHLNIEEELQDKSIKIGKNDILRINITSLSQESNTLFTVNRQNALSGAYEGPNGYRVGKDGQILLPVIGNIKVDGLTMSQAEHLITNNLTKYVKEPIVEIQLLNFKITVIGEVNRPSSFTISGDRINLLEALGMAGDMTMYGKRENVLVIREQEGKRIMQRLNLNEEDVLNSVFFNLQQNDIVYVEPDKSKAIEYSSNTRVMPIIIASISAVALLISAILRN